MNEAELLVQEWKKRDPLLEDYEGFSKFLDAKMDHTTPTFRFKNAQYFREILRAVNAFVDEVNFKLSQEGLYLRTMDAGRVSMLELEIPESAFESFNVPADTYVNIDIKKLLSCLKNVYKKDAIIWEIDTVLNRLTLHLLNDLNRKYEVSFLEYDMLEEPPTPKIDFNVELSISLSALNMVCKDVADMEFIGVTATEDTLEFNSVGEFESQYSTVFRLEDPNLLRLDTIENSKANFSKDYITNFTKALTKLANVAKIKFSTDMPICFEADVAGGSLKFWLAPRIEIEEANPTPIVKWLATLVDGSEKPIKNVVVEAKKSAEALNKAAEILYEGQDPDELENLGIRVEPLTESEFVLEMMMPSPDEAPIINCPHCGTEYNTSEQEPDDFEILDVENEIYQHNCGGFVKMTGLMD